MANNKFIFSMSSPLSVGVDESIIGQLSDLTTIVHNDIVSSINEINGKFPVSVENGGTGQTSLTSGNILLGNGTNAITSTDVLPVSKGGTGGATAAAARTNLDVYSESEVNTLLNGKADTSDIPTDLNQLSNTTTKYVNETQLQNAIDSLGSVFTLKGSVATVNDLPNSGNVIGDVYYVESVSGGYLWLSDNGVYRWEALGNTIDTSDFLTKSGLLTTTGNSTTNTMTQDAITTALNGKASSSDIPTNTSDLINDSNFVSSTSLATVATSGSYADLSNTPTALTDFSGTLPVTQGGTGQTSLNSGEILLGNGTSAITSVSTLPIASGGTGGSTATAARTNLKLMTCEQLYYNTLGTAGTISLSHSLADYQAIEIFYFEDDYDGKWCDSLKIWNDHTQSAYNASISSMFATTYTSDSTTKNRIKIFSANLYFSSLSVTWGYAKMATFTAGGDQTVSDLAQYGTHKIYRIVGYKY